MKLICTILFLCTAIASTMAQDQPETIKHAHHISILSMRNEVFYFKVDQDFIGATVQVYDSTGTVVFTSQLNMKRNLIDFYNIETGKYTIHFENNGVAEDYQVWLDKKDKVTKAHHFSTFKLRA